MRKIVIITPGVDENDDLLGFFVGWLKEFASRFDRVEVITLVKSKHQLPSNVFVHSLGKEQGGSRLVRAIRFYVLLFRLLPQSVGIFAPFSPIFILASWPVAFLFRKKIVLWYLHRAVTWRLRLAEKLCFKIVTADQKSLNVKSSKILELGHGIDVNYFWQAKNEFHWVLPLQLISVGRISPIKNFETIIKSVKILQDQNTPVFLKIVGQPLMPGDQEYKQKLITLIEELGLKDKVKFTGFVPHDQIRDYYWKADLAINALPDGGLDKTVLEGMASGLLTLTSNKAFQKHFSGYAKDLIFKYKNPDDLADKIKNLANLPTESKKMLSTFLAGSIAKFHNQKILIEKISQLYQ